MRNRYHEPLKSKLRCRIFEYRMLFFLLKFFLNCKSDLKAKKKCVRRIKQCRYNIKSNDYPEDLFFPLRKRVAVYTCIFGEYDKIKPVLYKNSFCDYFIITDSDVNPQTGWKILNVDFPAELQNATPAMKNRYCKMHPHVLFPQYDYSIYIDGSIQIYADIFPLLGRMGEHFIGMYNHASRDCLYAEGTIVVKLGKAPKKMVDEQLSLYRKEGYPVHYGLTDCIVIVRKHNDSNCIKVMNMWWKIFLQYPKRDQLGFGYALWKNGLSFNDVACLGINHMEEARFKSSAHLINTR